MFLNKKITCHGHSVQWKMLSVTLSILQIKFQIIAWYPEHYICLLYILFYYLFIPQIATISYHNMFWHFSVWGFTIEYRKISNPSKRSHDEDIKCFSFSGRYNFLWQFFPLPVLEDRKSYSRKWNTMMLDI